MSLNSVPAGKDLPNDFNVIIEISANSDPVKYEVDKDTGALFVDRFIGTSMHYPCNYGYINHTLGDDGDPVDVLVITPFPLVAGSVVRCRALGVLNMVDDGGNDAKLLAVPVEKLCNIYSDYKDYTDVPEPTLNLIKHFFEHYKDLEKGKWVKMKGWADIAAAHKEITDGVERYNVAK